MAIFRRSLPFLLTVLTACSAAGPAELPVPEEPLPIPGGGEDPSAWDYFRHGELVFEEAPATAAEAFYWASRRDPTWATPLFARRLALFLENDYLFSRYLSGNRKALRDPRVQQLDSLYLRALKLNPFLDRRLDGRALKQLWRQSLRLELQHAYPTAQITDMDITIAVERYSREASPEFRGMLAHSEGRLGDAAELYGKALEKDPDDVGLHADLARVLFMLGRHEQAVEHLQAAIAELRSRDEDELQRIYNSKALYLHAIGLIEEARQDPDAARAVYAEALQEDLSYYPAHVRLAELALATGDTATAVSEMRLAADIAPDEAAVLVSYGRLLEATGELGAAEATFRHLTEIEPRFAAPFARLAAVLEKRDRLGDALATYRTFVDISADDENGLAEARERIAELERTVSATTPDDGGDGR